ncbi:MULTISPECIES: sensor histidine kinase [unclassified Corynebacterium]|uniref:sensor histidine kinase n=1 Tax=unclassified Corynebacterium TaxID=2624378 RepID=UPI00352453B6
MSVWAGFVGGVILTLWAVPAVEFLRRRLRTKRSAATLAEHQVTTVSQVLHLAVQGAPTAVTVVGRGGDVVLSNSRAHEMGIVHERSLNEKVWECALKVFEDRESRVIDLAGPARRAGSRVMAVQAVVKPLTRVDSRFVIVYGTDESENLRMESARRDFVANVSHELKTPVGGMALLAEALIESADDPESVSYFGGRLTKEAHRLADMINELISLSKLQGAEKLPGMEPVSVDSVIAEALSRNELSAENAGISLVRGADTGVEVDGDASLLITAVSNLIGNAINYSPSETTVSVSQKVSDDGSEVYIRVTDRGIGIAPEDQKRVFERFFRVDKARSRSTGGTGLGLAIVKHVAANHGGSITLWSRPGTGSTFTLILPVHRAGEDDPPDGVDLAESIELTKKPAPLRARRKDRAT